MSDRKSDGSGEENVRFVEDTTAWATWLYYAESRTQAEVAKALGVSRASVANYLADARRRGLVTISRFDSASTSTMMPIPPKF